MHSFSRTDNLIKPFDLVHQNAILGCQSWSCSDVVQFEWNNELIWYHSKIKDILFNSVLHGEYSPGIFKNLVKEILYYAKKNHSDIAWLIANPEILTEEYLEIFVSSGFTRCIGTTGMHLKFSDSNVNGGLSAIIDRHNNSDIEIKEIKTDEQLKKWAEILFTVYNFPINLAAEWYKLHRGIGFDRNARWRHLELLIDDVMVGTGSIYCGPKPQNASFANLAIMPVARGRGLGSLLTAHALTKLKELGYTDVTLYASDDALKLYEKLNFKDQVRNTFFVYNCSKA
jgi:ribosomal protein S18 acetylase RimI-like enzyme